MIRFRLKQILVSALLAFFLLSMTSVQAGNKKKDFVLFNSIHYRNTPDLSAQGLHPLHLFYDHFLLTPSSFFSTRLPHKDSIRKVALKSLDRPEVPVTLDIEVWDFDSGSIDSTISYYLRTIDWFKKTNSKSQLGFYGVVPANIIYKWKKLRTEVNGIRSFEQLNARLQPVADRVDIFFPAFYTYDEDTLAWKEAVTATVKAVKRYSKGKPVYGYIWPQFHNGTPKQLQYLSPAMWNFQLETLYQLTDGVVIWTSNKDADNKIISWSDEFPWWKVTQAFIKRHGLN